MRILLFFLAIVLLWHSAVAAELGEWEDEPDKTEANTSPVPQQTKPKSPPKPLGLTWEMSSSQLRAKLLEDGRKIVSEKKQGDVEFWSLQPGEFAGEPDSKFEIGLFRGQLASVAVIMVKAHSDESITVWRKFNKEFLERFGAAAILRDHNKSYAESLSTQATLVQIGDWKPFAYWKPTKETTISNSVNRTKLHFLENTILFSHVSRTEGLLNSGKKGKAKDF